jgi:hypothetical protein
MAQFGPGNAAARTHGATSEAQIRPLAANHRRRVLRRLGLSARDLSPLARGFLDLYCRLSAKVDQIDRYIGEHGLIRPDGEPQPVMKVYVSLCNSQRLSLQRLEDAVKAIRRSPGDELAAYLAANEAEEEDDAS